MSTPRKPKQMIPYPFRHFTHWFGTRYGVCLTGSVPGFRKGLTIGKVEITPEKAEALLQLLDEKSSKKAGARRVKKEAIEEPLVEEQEDKEE